jgi:membrane protein implicated in regulation of membrane protease activity
MREMNMPGKTFILIGAILIVVGVVLNLGGRLPWLGRLPGDIYVQNKNFTFFFPVTTSILISIIVSVILLILRRR